MPHIKVSPFDTAKIDTAVGDFIKFRAVGSSSAKEIVLLSDKREFFLDIVKKEGEYLIKPNKITKGSDTELLKDMLNRFANVLGLDILHSNTAPKPFKPKNADEFFKTVEDFYEFKSDFKNIKLEVGFGSGRHLLYRAQEEPETLFIGIEIHSPSINQLLKQINIKGLKNIFVVNYDARLLLEMLPSNILDTIYVHFPVPWDKKPHRRVISDAFVREALRVLKKGGQLELRTDSQNYFEYSLEVFSSLKQSSFKVEKNIDIPVVSKYEARWRRMEKNIYTLTLDSLSESKARELKIDFTLENCNTNTKIPQESIIKEDFFVHFGKKYTRTDNKGFVVECSFGGFNTPEKKMIIVGEKCYYLPGNPVKSLVNYKAHNIIREVLNG